MSEVLPFKRPEPEPVIEKHLAGEAVCLTCWHEWAAVAPVGTTCLECPSCGTMRGSWLYPILAANSQFRFTCDCGSELFSLLPDEIMCAGCGLPTQGY